MDQQSSHQEQQLLAQYASVTNSKILDNPADLNPKDHPSTEMLAWCLEHGSIVVLQSGAILSNQPSSRLVQNCKIVMQNKGLAPGDVHAASSKLIHTLLDSAQQRAKQGTASDFIVVSTQQQRLRSLVKEALKHEASDIHIEVRSDVARIRFRKHGELFLYAEWLPKLGREIASVAFNKETDHATTHFNPLIPQNASMPLQIDDRYIRLRLASLPAHQGFDVVLRILTLGDEKVSSLEQLGYQEQQIRLIKRAINMPAGAVIVSGPTGSGKTTTLASCMSLVDQRRKVYTIEDPVEKVIPLSTQIPVNTEHNDRDFASMARTTLRMDPDVIVLGEMRDEDTAAVMVRAAITGHLVFSTLHTHSATGIITRLLDLGVPTALLSNPNLLVCLICQRLAPQLCKQCAVPVGEAQSHQAYLSRWHESFADDFFNLKARSSESCQACNGLGISERKVIAEIIWVDELGREFIRDGDSLGWCNYLQENQWRSYRDQLLNMVRNGEVDPLDAEKIIGEINTTVDPQRFIYADEEPAC